MYNQIIKVLRLAGNPSYPEPCYLIELPDRTRAELPCSWAVPANLVEQEPACSPCEAELLAGVEEYLELVRLVRALAINPAPEETRNEHDPHHFTSDRDPQQRLTRLGSTAHGVPDGADPDSGGSAPSPAPASGARERSK